MSSRTLLRPRWYAESVEQGPSIPVSQVREIRYRSRMLGRRSELTKLRVRVERLKCGGS